MAPQNHRHFAQTTGANRYVLHTSSLLPDQQAHFSKFLAVEQHMRQNPDADWVLFVDCDAFFTDLDTSIPDLLATYLPEEVAFQASGGRSKTSSQKKNLVNFLVAEDTGGINTGVFLLRNVEWSHHFLYAVTQSVFSTAWDQSMIFMTAVNATLFGATVDKKTGAAGNDLLEKDFELPKEVLFLHQSRLNAFVPPASTDWQAYEWREGDLVKHFAGCPWQEKPCLGMMEDTVRYVEEKWGKLKENTS